MRNVIIQRNVLINHIANLHSNLQKHHQHVPKLGVNGKIKNKIKWNISGQHHANFNESITLSVTCNLHFLTEKEIKLCKVSLLAGGQCRIFASALLGLSQAGKEN